MLQHIVSLLQRLAASRNLAVVVLSQCVTKMRPGEGPVLVPAVSTTAWEQGLGARVVLFRDWGWNDEEGSAVTDVRFAEVLKAEGAVVGGRRRLVGFSIGRVCLEIPSPSVYSYLTCSRLVSGPWPCRNACRILKQLAKSTQCTPHQQQ
jgi:hypothetical protein